MQNYKNVIKKRLNIFLCVILLLPCIAIAQATLPVDNSDDWLRTSGNRIVDSYGNPVWLTGTNWFGLNTGSNTLDGLWSTKLESALSNMAKRGINVIRIPISTELMWQWSRGIYPKPTNINTALNPRLARMNSLQFFDFMVAACRHHGIKLIIDAHSAQTDPMGHLQPLWYDPEITTSIFYKSWEWFAARYKNNDSIIAFDLKNEPHGLVYQQANAARWDNSTHVNNWKIVAQTASKKILNIHPKILILVEGVEAFPKSGKTFNSYNANDYNLNWWGGNLRGVKNYPIQLGQHQDQLVYSPHDYGPAVYRQPWFKPGFNQQTLYNDVWKNNWAFIMEQNIAPIIIGEWGGFMDGGDNQKWLTALRNYIKQQHIHHTFWAFNANSGDTGGLVKSDFRTWEENKYALLKPALWQNISGKFVSLDHKIPLGGMASRTGITVNKYYQQGGTLPVSTFP